jgi:Na+/H+ antiporter NhaD/arsenite permease-like protein
LRLGDQALLLTATILTSFNDNAAITYLAAQVPALATPGEVAAALRHAVVAGALAGGGLTVIANAPNPAGQSILAPHFEGAVSPWKLALWATIPTLLAVLCLGYLRV